MAENSGIDSALRDAFTQAAEHGDSTGVADAIRSRVAAGDTGTAATGASAPGFHGGMFHGGVASWLPWVGLVVVAGVVGSALGVSGVFGHPTDDVAVAGYTSVLKARAHVASCPGGPVVGSLDSGTRVLAVERSADDAHIGVRNPADFSSVVWLDTVKVTIDSDEAAGSSLPIGNACPVVTVVAPTQEPTPEPTEPTPPIPPNPPAPTTPPAPPKDTVNPTIGTPTAAPNPIYNDNGQNPLVLQVPASDNVGVTSVSISWAGAMSGSGTMTKSGGSWKFSLAMPANDHFGFITFTMRAQDAAGNLSNPASIIVDHQYFG